MKLGKKQMMLLLAIVCIVTQCLNVAYTKAATRLITRPGISMFMVNLSRINVDLSIDNTGNASGTIYARVYNGDTARAYIYLDRYINGRWTCIEASQQSGYPTLIGNLSSKVQKGYDYRLRVTIFVYTNGTITETLNDISSTVSY